MRLRSLGVLLAFIVSLVFSGGCFSEEPTFINTRYTYGLEIKTGAPLENVTLLVPIPMRGDRAVIGPEPISAEYYTERLPDHYTCSIVPVDGGYYLQLTAPFMSPAEPVLANYYNYTYLGQKFRPEIVPQMANTLYPSGNASLFSPKQNLTLTSGSPEVVQTSGNNPGYSCSYTIPVYAQYENGAWIEIFSYVRGNNEWDEGFNENQGNYYYDSYHLTITGEPQGWTTAGGVLTAGKGNYREWQLNLSPTSGLGG